MRAHLSAAHFVNESSPVIDSSPLHLAIVERHCSLHRVLCSSHPWRGSVAHNASNFLQSAPRYAYLSSDVLPRKKLSPLLCLCYTESCQIADTFSEALPTFVMLRRTDCSIPAWPALAYARSEARKNICAINVRLGGKFRTHADKYPRYVPV